MVKLVAGTHRGQEVIRKAREARGWTQRKLADLLGVTHQTVYNQETGRRRAKWKLLCRAMPELLDIPAVAEAVERKPQNTSKRLKYPDQILIRIARLNRKWPLKTLAAKIHFCPQATGQYELGHVLAPWKILEEVMPELKEMKQNGCEHYCNQPRPCLGGGICRYRRR